MAAFIAIVAGVLSTKKGMSGWTSRLPFIAGTVRQSWATVPSPPSAVLEAHEKSAVDAGGRRVLGEGERRRHPLQGVAAQIVEALDHLGRGGVVPEVRGFGGVLEQHS